ncbi:MAG: diacylglycerol kinase family protein, partial [Ilumatobacter sp.]|nr:diacylglycerol kinase family protein [Ilumatobacter sp.]
MRSVYILSNPTARGGPTQLDGVVAAFARFDVDTTVLPVATPAEARAAAQRAVSDGASRLIAVGGDGMVHLAVNAVAESETVLGVVPLGTGNDFARALGLLDGDIDE